MAYRNIRIESGSNIKIKDAQLIINDVSIPIEDINCLMLENRSSNISTYALAKLADSWAVTFAMVWILLKNIKKNKSQSATKRKCSSTFIDRKTV